MSSSSCEMGLGNAVPSHMVPLDVTEAGNAVLGWIATIQQQLYSMEWEQEALGII